MGQYFLSLYQWSQIWHGTVPDSVLFSLDQYFLSLGRYFLPLGPYVLSLGHFFSPGSERFAPGSVTFAPEFISGREVQPSWSPAVPPVPPDTTPPARTDRWWGPADGPGDRRPSSTSAPPGSLQRPEFRCQSTENTTPVIGIFTVFIQIWYLLFLNISIGFIAFVKFNISFIITNLSSLARFCFKKGEQNYKSATIIITFKLQIGLKGGRGDQLFHIAKLDLRTCINFQYYFFHCAKKNERRLSLHVSNIR